jgi:hypothetical protein
VSTTALLPIIEAFKANIERIDGVGSSLALVTGLTGLSGSKYSTYYIIADEAEAPSQQMIDNYMSQAALYLRFNDKMRDEAMQRGRGELRVWLLHHKPLQAGIETIFSSQMIATWTAIEVLAADLWEAALNSHPAILADLSGSPKRIKPGFEGGTPDRSDEGGNREVRLTEIRRVTRGQYDLSDKMGTLLIEKFDFSRLSGIRSAYSTAFSKNSANVDAALRSAALDAASIVRNLLVHRAGVADEEYVDRAKGAGLPKLATGDRFPLNGNTSAKIIREALDAAVGLIKAVDGWLKTH